MKNNRKRRKFALTVNFLIYFFILALSLVFTQALYSSVSSVMFIFVCIIPFVSLIYILLSLPIIKVHVNSSCNEVCKFTPVGFEVNLENMSVFPYPFVEVDIMLPNESFTRCTEKRVQASLIPFGYYKIKNNVRFCYRGEYKIGISKIYIYDMFKMFRITLDINTFIAIFVTPRRLILNYNNSIAASDINTDLTNNIHGIDRSELTDIRDYRNGDHMNSIHWKLSSKRQELVVKEYAMNSGKNTYIFVDMAKHYNISDTQKYKDDINEYVADGVTELAIATVLKKLNGGDSCIMVWYDERVEGGIQICPLQTPEDLDKIFMMFATAELCPAEQKVSCLIASVETTQEISMIFVTGAIDEILVDDLSKISAVYSASPNQYSIEVYYCNPKDKITENAFKEYKEYTDSCCERLFANAIGFVETKF